MKLTDLDPAWIELDGRRIGFVFISPCQKTRVDGSTNPTLYRLTCLSEQVPMNVQREIAERMFGDDDYTIVPCNPKQAWTIAGGIDQATFETMTVSPSLDGSGAGLWHGFIKNGEIQ